MIASTSGRVEPVSLATAFQRARKYPQIIRRYERSSRCGHGSRPCTAKHAFGVDQVGQQHEGLFGTWTLEEEDRREVLSYRVGLTVAATALVLDSVIVLLPDGTALREAGRSVENVIASVGAASLGASFWLIHIYVTPLKRFLQALYAVGVTGALYLALLKGVPVPEYVAEHREAVWIVGPLFASLTGLGIKEGLCYGTGAAVGITIVTPILCLGHLTGLMPEAGTQALLVVLNLLAVAFAAGKYGQPIKGDIGDKSIFQVMALPKEEQQRRWEALEQSRAGSRPSS